MSTLAPHEITRRRRLAGVWVGLLVRVDEVAGRIGDRVHASTDQQAAAEGWQVTATRWGGRSYRHPGFVARQANQ